MEKLERKAASVTSRSYWIWIEIFHQNLFLLRSAVLVWSNGLKFLVFMIIFTGEIKKKDVIPWTCESFPGDPVDPLQSQGCLKDRDLGPEGGSSPGVLGTLVTAELLPF